MPNDFLYALSNTINGDLFCATFGNPSNIILTDNPPFTLEDFASIFPVFKVSSTEETATDEIPFAVFNLFLSMANACIKYDRYKENWKYLMCLFIAHYFTLFLETQKGNADNAAALASAMPKGIAVSKSVDGLSVSYDMQDTAGDFMGYGTYKYTSYGQQLITLTKLYRGMGMWVNG